MELPIFLDKLRKNLLIMAEVGYADAQIQARHEALIKQHFELLRIVSLSLDNSDSYPLSVALDMVTEIQEAAKQFGELLRAKIC